MPVIEQLLYQTDKSIHRRCSIEKAVCKRFCNILRKLCWSLFWDKVELKLQVLIPAILLKETLTQFFPLNIAIFPCFEERPHTTASKNNKRFLGKVTSHNDHYMIFMGSQRPKIGGNWLLTGLYLQNWNRETVFSCQGFHHTNIVQFVPPYHIISNVHICFFTLLSPLGWCPKLLLGIVTSHKNKHAGLLVLHLLLLLNLCSLLKCGQLKSFLSVLLWYSAELTQLVSLPFSCGRSTRYSNRLHDFFVTIPWCYKDVYVNSFFPCTARLWNSLPIECFPLTHNLNGFKSRINKHLLTAGSL